MVRRKKTTGIIYNKGLYHSNINPLSFIIDNPCSFLFEITKKLTSQEKSVHLDLIWSSRLPLTPKYHLSIEFLPTVLEKLPFFGM